MQQDEAPDRRDILSLAEPVIDTRITTLQTSTSVERLKLVCAREAVLFPALQCDLDDSPVARTVQDVRRELGQRFDHGELVAWLSSPNVWLRNRIPVDLLVSDASWVLAAARTDRFVVEG